MNFLSLMKTIYQHLQLTLYSILKESAFPLRKETQEDVC